MSRYKGRQNAKAVERDLSNQDTDGAGIVHFAAPFAFCDLVPQIRQGNIDPKRSTRFCFRYWPTRLQRSHDRRTYRADIREAAGLRQPWWHPKKKAAA
jgi:hypothetical protein